MWLQALSPLRDGAGDGREAISDTSTTSPEDRWRSATAGWREEAWKRDDIHGLLPHDIVCPARIVTPQAGWIMDNIVHSLKTVGADGGRSRRGLLDLGLRIGHRVEADQSLPSPPSPGQRRSAAEGRRRKST